MSYEPRANEREKMQQLHRENWRNNDCSSAEQNGALELDKRDYNGRESHSSKQ